MSKHNKIVISIIIIILALGSIYIIKQKDNSKSTIKIGIITPLTGGVAYWGESSSYGIKLAEKDLANEGINVKFIVEDGQLDPITALSAAQKLVNIDRANGIYSEFNPAAISVSSFLKGKNILGVYDAAPVSPLKEGRNIYKTYLDYETGCEDVAQIIKNRGITNIGVLKVNLEFGDLCLKGIKNVYGDNLLVEEYNAGTIDFRSALTKLKAKKIQVIFNVSFQPETLASLKQARELGMSAVYAGLSETISPDIIPEYSKLFEGSIMFGLPNVSQGFIDRINTEFPGKTVSNYQAAALAYIHLKQMAKALNKCGEDMVCVEKEMDSSKPEAFAGFTGFKNHIAGFSHLIQEWKGGKFVDIN